VWVTLSASSGAYEAARHGDFQKIRNFSEHLRCYSLLSRDIELAVFLKVIMCRSVPASDIQSLFFVGACLQAMP
jgi:hypothetical protein